MTPVYLARSPDRWHWSEDAVPALDFAVHALLTDGLRVPPLDQHPDGDRRLRSLGLDPASWRQWVGALVARHAMLAAAIAAVVREPTAQTARDAASILAEAPGLLCPGPEALREALLELWSPYAPGGETWRRQVTGGDEVRRRRGTARDQRRLWKLLLPFHDGLSSLSVFVISYPQPVVMAIPPTTALIAPAGAPASWGRQVAHAAELLSGVSARGERHRW